MDLIDRINNTRFLGKEFLTWLWFKSEKNEGLVEVPELGTVELWFDDKIVLTGADATKEQNILKGESPTETPEARAALRMGKKVAEAKIRIVHGQRKWALSVKAENLALSGVKIPALLTREEDDRIYERFALLEELNNAMAALYRGFIALRVDAERWEDEVAQMQHWVASDPV